MGFFKKLFGKKDGGDGNDKWNAMWELWEQGEIPSPYNEMLTYDSEMQSGGHLQFFINRALRQENIFSVMAALRETLAAFDRWYDEHEEELLDVLEAYADSL